MYQRAKYIDTRIYRVRELSASGDVSLYKVPGEYQPADLFTKGLPRVAFERHRRYLMGESASASGCLSTRLPSGAHVANPLTDIYLHALRSGSRCVYHS